MWKQVLAPTLLVSALWVTVSLATSHFIQRTFESHSRTHAQDFGTIQAAWSMRRDLWKIQSLVAQPGSMDSPEKRDAIRAVFRGFDQSLTLAGQTSVTAAEQSLVRKIRRQYDQYMQILGPALEARTPVDAERSAALIAAAANTARELVEVNQEQIREQAAQNELLRDRIIAYRKVLLIVGPLTGVGLGLLVARHISRSLSRMRVRLSATSSLLDEPPKADPPGGADNLPALQAMVDVVTDRFRGTVDQLHRTRHDLARSERLAAIGELAAGVAHEIRNPLTSVKLLIQTAALHSSGPRLNERQYQVMIEQILRMERTVQELLDFARPPAPRRVRHAVQDTVARALSLLHGRFLQHRVQLVEDFGPQPVFVTADSEQLQTVFSNLAINAVQAMPEGGILRVCICQTQQTCEVSLRDSGKGIPLDLLPRVFDPFVTSKQHGSGLGLAICRRIIEEHEGKLIARNHPEGGAELRVLLPLDSPPTTGSGESCSPEQSPAVLESTGAR